MNRSEWTGIILGTGVLALGVYAGLILLGALTERSADSADACMIRNHGKIAFKLRFPHGGEKLVHSRSIGRISSGKISIQGPNGQILKAQCPPGGALDIITRGRRIAIAKR